jgi:nitrogenase molybdenum-iron protein alpha/beta subunit
MDNSTLAIIGILCTVLITVIGFTVNYVIKSFKEELQQDRIVRAETMKNFGDKVDKVEKFLEKISEEMFSRISKVEISVNKLWSEHNLIKEQGFCGVHVHNRRDDDQPSRTD